MPRALLGLGANEGNREATFSAALHSLVNHADIRELARSQWRTTAPIGGPEDQATFLNGACLIETGLSPHELWQRLAATEHAWGRRRQEHWGARTLDLDLLLYDEQIVDDDVLTVPHPRFPLRRFVLEPAAEIAGAMRHPTLDCAIEDLWRHVTSTPQQATIRGGTLEIRAQLAARVALHPQAWPLVDDGAPRPRLAIELHEFKPAERDTKRLMTRWDGGLVLRLDALHGDEAAQEVVLAMRGLAD
jgi:2-amino-4-hydroxy-6-hydroxymethyldihydropteridine diphosphokinase